VDNLAPLLFFALIGLVQLLVRWVRTMQQQQRQQPPPSAPAPGPEVEVVVPRLPFRPSEMPPVTRLATPAPRVLVDTRATPPPRRAAHHRHPRLGSRTDVRRAIVLMEILGAPRSTSDVEGRGR
jgi:hypothetical protein